MTEQHVAIDPATGALVIRNLHVEDPAVTAEARRWTAGTRGPVVDDAAVLVAADLGAFVAEALHIGARAITATASERDSLDLERVVRDVGERASTSSSQAAELTRKAAADAADAVRKASEEARRTFTEADGENRKQFTATVTAAKTELSSEVQRLFGGENPEVLDRLRPLLDKFAGELDAKVARQTGELLEKAARQFDPSDPTSPMAKHQVRVAAEQEKLAARIGENHVVVAAKLEELTTSLKVQEGRRALASVTPIKGGTFEVEMHALMTSIAAGLGDEYDETGATAGRLSRNKKGDGVLRLGNGSTAVVLEMTDSARAGWSAYLDEAERNRDALASLGLVRSADQNGGHTLRVLGPRRIVMAFDPATDDTDLLRTVVQLLRTVAQAAATRGGARDLTTADEKLVEALAALGKVDEIKKSAGAIQKSAQKIDAGCDVLVTQVRRAVEQARTALEGAATGASGSSTVVDGAA